MKTFTSNLSVSTDYMELWYHPMDFGNDMSDEEPDREDNFNFE